MKRTELIQLLIDRYDLKSYVEIGTQKKKNNFDLIRCDRKTSVDPDPESDADIHLTSDEFFRTKVHPLCDLVFIDGLHEREQVKRDIQNALAILSDKGFVVVHDCNPPNELVQRMPRPPREVTKQWYGNVWEAWVQLRSNLDLEMYVVDTDCGCGVIVNNSPGTKLIVDTELTFLNFDANRVNWLNLISVDYFKELHA